MKAILLLLGATLLFSLVAARSEQEYVKAWLDFTSTYQKTYSHDAVHYRYRIFKQNLDFIDANNNKTLTYTVAMNKFGDLTNDEFAKFFLGTKVDASNKKSAAKEIKATSQALPTSWDWRSKGAVTPIKDQGQCGSCWAFSTTGSTEGCHFLTTGTLVSLSEQNLVDCSQSEGNDGCDGGLMDYGFQYIINNKGIDTEASYPYTAEDGTCAYNAANCASTVTSFADVTSGSESALQASVYQAPTSVAMDASQSSFQFYSSGVYSDPNCSSQQLDHGILAVGWGVDGSQDYWIVKNSWGTGWGINGYFWLARNDNNMCGIATAASKPSGCGNCA